MPFYVCARLSGIRKNLSGIASVCHFVGLVAVLAVTAVLCQIFLSEDEEQVGKCPTSSKLEVR